MSRWDEGRLWVFSSAGGMVFGPVRCRGEADNSAAREHDNVQEDPTHAYGDHPYGVYQVASIVRFTPDDPHYGTYGPAFICLNPLDGEALQAKRNGRTGIGLHGGRLHANGRLRETFGCNRVDDNTVETIATLVDQHGLIGVEYECRPASVTA